MPPPKERGAIALAEKLMSLLDQGHFTATYKYAVLLGLMDLCLENTARSGRPPTILTTRQMAEKVFELYWPQVVPYAEAGVLRQTPHRRAAILAEVEGFREFAGERLGQPHPLLARAQAVDPEAYEESVRRVEKTLIHYPLVLLQKIGREESRFLYEYGWDPRTPGGIRSYQQGDPSSFDNRLLLQPHVGEYLVQLNNLLRPLIHRQWSAAVARMNRLEEAKLEEFLFSAQRVSPAVLRRPLLDLQNGRCFYCGRSIRSGAEVDHFLPWSRYPDNGIQNLVVADRRCNSEKRDFLAAATHVERWATRADPPNRHGRRLRQLALEYDWEMHPRRTLSVARAVYLRLPDDVRLWLRADDFVPADRTSLGTALAGG